MAVADRLSWVDRKLGDAARSVRGELIFHLHRLDDADHLAGFDLVTVGDLDREHGPLHRRHHGVLRA